MAQAGDFAEQEEPIRPPGEGEILVVTRYLSVEPTMRGWIADRDGYAEPVPIGAPMRSLASGQVIASRDPAFAPGDWVMGWFGWQTYATIPASAVVRAIGEDELTLSLGILRINGLTAYLGLTLVGQPRPGETVLVSTAAGAVGSAVGQIARRLGCRAVGVAGGPEKAWRCLDVFGFDAAIDYRAPGLADAVRQVCPDGVHIFFDNTAGTIADAVHPQLAIGARVVVCGTASFDRWQPWPTDPRVERHLLVKRARMEGFVVFEYQHRYAEAIAALRGWLAEGALVHREEVLDGLSACPDALAGLYRGENAGKRLIRVDP